jgi:glycosyltransferase involved in cell wall biosynthesis
VNNPSIAEGKVSIIIPCYNHGSMLLETLASIEQVRSDTIAEVTIVDDGSKEPTTCQILQDLDAIKYRVVHQANQGPAKARNAGIQIARGEFILPLDSDNLIREAYFTFGVALLIQNPDVGVVYGDAEYFGEKTGSRTVAEFDWRPLVKCNYIDNCGLYRRSVWESVGGYDEEKLLVGLEDWDFWLRVALRGWRFAHIGEIAFDYRVRQGSLTCDVKLNGAEMMTYLFEKPEYAVLKALRNQGEELERLMGIERSLDYKVGSSIIAPLRAIKRLLFGTHNVN